jgi:ketosteroid isomerase-like protein
MKTIKTSILLTFILLLSTSISNAQESTLEFENAKPATDLVINYVEALQKGDVDKMNAQLADNVFIQGLGGGTDTLNLKQHTVYYKESTSKYTHKISRELYLPVKVTNNWNEGEWVLSWGTNTITNKETNNIITVPYHTASMVENGKIVRLFYFYDMLNILAKEGWAMTPPK